MSLSCGLRKPAKGQPELVALATMRLASGSQWNRCFTPRAPGRGTRQLTVAGRADWKGAKVGH
ncbi:hypothetical protein AGR1B_pAt30281 [Agrobacterium fabacearum S56]|nr:hypothetical protein AGR1B_pAt30281 [Agrobacterium fabacearum S56]